MDKSVRVKLTWLTKQEGGRKSMMPIGVRYCPILIMDNLERSFEQGSDVRWSADIQNLEILTSRESIASLAYLFSEAPHEFLSPGNSFKLYEGDKLVSYGVILE